MIYTFYQADWENCTITTIEGREFFVNPYDMSAVTGWTPTNQIYLNVINGAKYLVYANDGTKVKIL